MMASAESSDASAENIALKKERKKMAKKALMVVEAIHNSPKKPFCDEQGEPLPNLVRAGSVIMLDPEDETVKRLIEKGMLAASGKGRIEMAEDEDITPKKGAKGK